MRSILHLLWALFSMCALAFPADYGLFRYDASSPLGIQQKGTETSGTIDVRDISFSGATGESIKAYLVAPQGSGPFAGILYVHWLGTPATSNRTEFLQEAKKLAQQRKVVSLLVEMPWSQPKWFRQRKLDDDYEFSVRQVKNLRRALDVLLSEKGVDAKQIAYVGHDFGAMYGALLLAVDPRVHYAVLMSGTPIFSDWFLLDSDLKGAAREKYIASMAPLDPLNFVGHAKSVPILFQFASHDEYVSAERAKLFAASAHDPKQVMTYDAGHELNEAAAADRIKWLTAKLGTGT